MLASISTIAGPKATQFKQLSEMSGELQRDNYHAVEGVRQREREVINHWNQFLTMLHNKEAELERLKELTKMILDLDTLSEELKQLELQVRRGRGIGRHLLAVEDNLQKHELLETNITANGDWLKSLKRQAGEYIRTRGEHMETLQEKVDQVGRHFDALVLLGSERRLALNRARSYFLFVQNCEEELSWLAEKQQFCQQILNQRDISTVTQATSLYKVLNYKLLVTAPERICRFILNYLKICLQ